MEKSLENDLSAPIKDIKLKFGTQPFLTMINKFLKCGQNYRW